jgi:hypothetical protein
MSCVLRAGGMEFDTEAYLAESPFKTASRYRRGDPRWPALDQASRTSGFNVTISDAGVGDLATQIEEAIAFLDEHEDELRRLGRFEGVEEVEIDFAVEWRDLSVQTDWFPPELLWRAGALDIALRVTHYLVQQRES